MQYETHLNSLIDVNVLQHLQDSFAEQKEVSLAIFDAQGNPVTQPARRCSIPTDVRRYFTPFIDFILTWPPNLSDLGLQDGNKIFSSFFNGLVHRAILPLAAPKRVLGAIQLIITDKNRVHEISQWRSALEGFSLNYISYLAFLDSYSFASDEKLVQLCTYFYEQLENLLEAGYNRFKKQEESFLLDVSINYGDIITTEHNDIIKSDLSIARILAYDPPAELLGINVIDMLIAQPDDRENIRHFLDIKGELAEYPLYLRDKNGRMLPVKIRVAREDLGKDVPEGFRYSIQVIEDQEIHRIDILDLSSRPSSSKPSDPKSTTVKEPIGAEVSRENIASDEQISPGAQLSADSSAVMILDSLHDPLFILDQHNHIVLWNRKIEEWLHISAKAVLGSDFSALLVGESQRRWQQWLFNFRLEQKLKEFSPEESLTMIDNNGDIWNIHLQMTKGHVHEELYLSIIITRWEKISLDQVFQPQPPQVFDGQPSSLIHPAHSPDARQDELAPMLGTMGRYFEKQISQIQRSVGLLSNEPNLTDPINNRILQIEQTVEQTLSNLQQLQLYSCSVPFHRRSVHMEHLLKKTANLQQPLFSGPSKINMDLQPDANDIMADPLLIHQAISLLINIARAATPEGGSLTLRLRNTTMPDPDKDVLPENKAIAVLIEVCYSSCNFSAQALQHLFEPFSAGQGLELAAVYGIVRSHQGQIDVTADAAHGTRFRIYLPAIKPVVNSQEQQQNVKRSATILIVDDERGIVDVNSLILQHHGLNVLSAASFKEGLKILDEHAARIDCIILDVMLPDLEAPESVLIIREHTNIPIILSSGYPPDEAVSAIIPLCGGPFLQKPYRKNALIHAIKKIIDKNV